MIPLVCFVLLCLLGMRSLMLMFLERKSFPFRLLDLLFTLLFGAGAFAVLFFTGLQPLRDLPLTILVFVILAMPFSLAIMLRLRKPYQRRAILISLKTIILILVLFVSLVVIMTSGFIYLTQDKPVLKITMTGIQKEEIVEWKPPERALRKEPMIAYQVVITKPDDTPVGEIYIYGDQVAVKARVLRFRPILNVAGLSNLCRVEFLFNGYTTADRHNSLPHRAQEISVDPLPFQQYQKRFWNFWENYYYLKGDHWLVKSATLESNFFPLLDKDGNPFQGSFYLTITPGGLSSTPIL